ncbi:hypothetical protein GYMLUDRAFT_74297 [Collybiopsis luxurians FD-317 M1]|uniref:DNA damage-binding protein 1 n=1 Tax=Collybiopsis luxurians FD-317 M1 TaxID=944289 RepID=A0A0D0CBH5_9AGAR|nr:hypothetical protein GYMLUDRAFT_74297 [Collybiopsis luxurians FD-317 M1]
MPTRIASTFHPASSVISSVKCSLLSGELEHLVIAKLNSLQVYSILESKLQLECNLEIRGKVRLVRAIPIKKHSRCNLFVLLDHPDPEVLILSYTESEEPGSGKLNLKHQISLEERGSRPAEFCTDALVHPSGEFAVVSCYAGKLKAISIDDGQVYNLQIFEYNLLSFAFLPLLHEDNYAVALLYLNHDEHIHIVARNLLISSEGGAELDNEISGSFQPTYVPSKYLPSPDESLPQLIPIPADDPFGMSDNDDSFLGGILVVGGTKVLLYELETQDAQEKPKGKRKRDARKQGSGIDSGKRREFKKREPKASVHWPWSRISTWSAIDNPLKKILIGDVFGRLAMLSLTNLENLGLVLVPLGETSPATTISYLTNQVAFVGSHLGDSQVVRISDVPVSSTETPTLPISNTIKTVSPESLNQLDDKGKGPSLDDTDNTNKGCIIATKGSYLNAIQTFKNIAPIRDAVLADLDGSDQAHIVTCSGGGNTGSVNVVRIGTDFEELASIPGPENTTNLWPVRLTYNSSEHSFFIITSLIETHVFQITHPNEVQLADRFHEFILNEQTLHIGTMVVKRNSSYDEDTSLVAQVTPSGAHLFQYDEILQKWTRVHTVLSKTVNLKGNFVAASGNASQLLIAQVHGWMVSYTIQGEADVYKLTVTSNSKLDYSTGFSQQGSSPELISPDAPRDWYNTEISAINCPVLDPAKLFSTFVAAAFWHTNQIKVYQFNSGNMEYLCQSPPLSSPIRSVILNYMTKDSYRIKDRDSHLCVFAGLADGTVVAFEMVYNEDTKLLELKNMNMTSLGHLPVAFTVHEVEGKRVVIAAGSRAVIFSWERSHLRVSPVMLKDITTVRAFNTKSYPNSLILTNASGISIGRVRSLDKMHIRSTSLGLDNPRQIVHEPTYKVFGVTCLRTQPSRIGEDERVASSFKLVDDTNLKVLAQVDFDHNEHVMSSVVINIIVNDQAKPLFCVGTMIFHPEELETTSGRIHLYEAYQPSPSMMQLRRVASENVGGCVYNLAVIEGMLAAAVNSSINLHRVTHEMKDSDSTVPEYSIKKIADWNHNYMVTSISSYDDHLMVADQFSSVSLLKLNGKQKLTTVARDYSPLWPVTVQAFDKETIIGADQALNLFIFSLAQNAGRAILRRDGYFHLGDLVTKFIRGSLASPDAAAGRGLKSTHIFCTLSGQIGVIIDVENEAASSALSDALTLLTSLEDEFPEKVNTMGGISHARYRAPRSSRSRSDADEPAHGILDGDLLEPLLAHMDASPQLVEQIFTANEFAYSLTELKKDLEALQNMH